MSCSGNESLDSLECRGVLPLRLDLGLPSPLPKSPGAAITSRHSKYGAFSLEFNSTASHAGMRTTLECISPMGNITPAPGAWPSTSASETRSMPARSWPCRPSGGNTVDSFVLSPQRSSANCNVEPNVSTLCEDVTAGSLSLSSAPSPDTLSSRSAAAGETASSASADAARERAIPESRAEALPARSSMCNGVSNIGDIYVNGGCHSPESAACSHASRSAMIGSGFLESPAAAASSQHVCVPSRMLLLQNPKIVRSKLSVGRRICNVMI